MGLLSKESVPEIGLFDEQGQFDATAAITPDLGHVLAGGVTSATIFNVIGMYGERSGPVPSEWQRATIVVSRTLLSAREMDYWTYFAARSEDPARTWSRRLRWRRILRGGDLGARGREDRHPPAASAGDRRARAVDGLDFDRGDVRGVTFDQPIPTRYQTGRRNLWSGVINTLSQRPNIDSVMIRFWKYGGKSGDSIRITARVDDRASFHVEQTFGTSERGIYLMEVFLFYPDSGSQYSRTTLSPILVE
jgi:hypothetical protein